MIFELNLHKLQSKPLKFRVIWILYHEVWIFWFYTLKFGSVSKTRLSVNFGYWGTKHPADIFFFFSNYPLNNLFSPKLNTKSGTFFFIRYLFTILNEPIPKSKHQTYPRVLFYSSCPTNPAAKARAYINIEASLSQTSTWISYSRI